MNPFLYYILFFLAGLIIKFILSEIFDFISMASMMVLYKRTKGITPVLLVGFLWNFLPVWLTFLIIHFILDRWVEEPSPGWYAYLPIALGLFLFSYIPARREHRFARRNLKTMASMDQIVPSNPFRQGAMEDVTMSWAATSTTYYGVLLGIVVGYLWVIYL